MDIKIWLTDGSSWEHINIAEFKIDEGNITFHCGSRVYVYYAQCISHFYFTTPSDC